MINLGQRIKKLIAGIFLILIIFAGSSTAFLYPGKAQAQAVVGIGFSFETVLNSIGSFLADAAVVAGKRAAGNALQLFLQRAAYDMGVKLASYDHGQGPLFTAESGKEFLLNAAADGFGEFVGDLNKDWANQFNICNPTSPQVKLNLKLGLLSGIQPRKPSCDGRQFFDNWNRFGGDVVASAVREFGPEGLSLVFQKAFEPQNNDVGAMLQINDFMNVKANLALDKAKIDRGVKSADYKDYTSKVAKRIQTPRVLIKASAEQTFIKNKAQQTTAEWIGTYITGAIRPNTYWTSLLASVTSTFSSALVTTLQKRLLSGLWKLDSPPSDRNGIQEGVAYSGRKNAEAQFAELLKPSISSEANIDLVGQFATCPERFAQPNNCVIDGGFQTAILNYSAGGAGLTIQEAISKGYLKGNWALLPQGNRNNVGELGKECYTKSYCYTNLVKLRRARVLPVGWEMAANVCDKQTCKTLPKLNDIIAEFNNCGQDAAHPLSEYCHLIDPNWVLKAPLSRCDAKVTGSLLLSPELPNRADTCVDDKSCIKESENGQCEAYGYCTREKNIWRFGGEQCLARFDSCRTYTDRNGTNLSLIDQTIESGNCNVNNAGCLWYSNIKTKPATSIEFEWSENLRDRIYFTGKVKQCSIDSAGCTRLVRTAPGIGSNLLRNGNFEFGAPGTPPKVDFWRQRSGSLPGELSIDSSRSSDGNNSLSPGISGYSQSVPIRAKATYLLSSFIINSDVTSGTAIFTVDLLSNGNSVLIAPLEQKVDLPNTNDHRSLAFSFSSELDGVDEAIITLSQESINGSIWFDEVILEESAAGQLLPSAYTEFASTNFIHIKKAPDYYGCYQDWSAYKDIVSCESNNGQWDIDHCNAGSQCSSFAPWCNKDEVGCESFTPVEGDKTAITGTPFGTDYCPAQCDGYSAFIQQSTEFEDGGSLDFFISPTSKQCSLEEAGCDEFTNLDSSVDGQGENREYYSFLRKCQKPNSDCKTFYTWEGSDTEGFQLRTYSLKSDISGNKPNEPQTDAVDTCTKAKFQSKAFPDCREFYYVDGQGQTFISYKTFSKTVICSDQCVQLRRTLTNGEVECQSHGGTWDAAKAFCTYLGLPRESTQCKAPVAGCREYKGNTGNNIRSVFTDDFENDSIDGWQGGTISNDAVKRFEHSLFNSATSILGKELSSDINKGNSYTLKFWAKTTNPGGGSLDVTFTSKTSTTTVDSNTSIGSVKVDNNWKGYTLGPIVFIDDASVGINSVLLQMGGFSRNQLFIDNIILEEVTDRVFVVKNSWNTPIMCDNLNQSPYGKLGLNQPTRDNPQAQLNCRAYTDRSSQKHYLKSFAELCRDDAVGCEALIDTKNTDAVSATSYNVLCDSTSGTIAGDQCTITGGEGICTVITGDSSCYIKSVKDYNSNVVASPSQVDIAADSIVYLVNDSKYKCDQKNEGCTEVALPVLNNANALDTSKTIKERWEIKYLINKPSEYTDILCNDDELFCQEFTGTNEDRRYFKDPQKKTCEYRVNVKVNGAIQTGWFKTNPSTSEPEACYTGVTTTTETAQGHIIGGRDVVALQDNYLVKQGHTDYDGWVGLCPSTSNQCTLFIDPLGTSDSATKDRQQDPTDHYYYLNDDKLDTNSCNGQVSLSNGCILFNDTSITNDLNYHSGASYLKSTNKNFDSVDPINCQGFGASLPGECANYVNITAGTFAAVSDSNRVLKVKKDRTCGEWLACQSNSPTIDENGNTIELCNQLATCIKFDASRPGQCAVFAAPNYDRLTTSYYQKRGTDKFNSEKSPIGWTSLEFSGYAIPDLFSIETLKGVQLDIIESINDKGEPKTHKDSRLFHNTGRFSPTVPSVPLVNCKTDDECTQKFTDDITDPQNSKEFTALCIENRCMINVDGSELVRDSFGNPASSTLVDNAPAPSCRAYPESTSPFTNGLLDGNGNPSNGFAGAKFCENGEKGEKCSIENGCSYTKITYGGQAVTRYINSSADGFTGICLGGGNRNGVECQANSDCTDTKNSKITGTCQEKDKKKIKYLGWQGYCLERDTLKTPFVGINEADYLAPCLTWLPVRHMRGLRNIYNNFVTAGLPFDDDLHYCAETTLVKDVYAGTLQCAERDTVSLAGCNNNDGDGENSRPNMVCPSGFFVVYGNCNTWGVEQTKTKPSGNSNGWCSSTNNIVWDTAPYQCVPMGSVHATSTPVDKDNNLPTTVKIAGNQTWKAGDSCWTTAKNLAGTKVGAGQFGGKQHIYAKVNDVWYKDAKPLIRPLKLLREDMFTKKEDTRSVFDDCVLPNVDVIDNPVGAVYISDPNIEGDYKLGCKLVVQVNEKNALNDIRIDKAWTDRVAYDSLAEKPAVAAYTINLGIKEKIPVSFRTPTTPVFGLVGFDPKTQLSSSSEYNKLSAINIITGCSNDDKDKTKRPSFFGIGVYGKNSQPNTVKCADSVNHGIHIGARDNVLRYSTTFKLLIDIVYSDQSASFQQVEYQLRSEVTSIDEPITACNVAGDGSECRVCKAQIKRVKCESTSDCKIGGKVDLGNCELVGVKNGYCEYTLGESSQSSSFAETVCGDKAIKNPAASDLCYAANCDSSSVKGATACPGTSQCEPNTNLCIGGDYLPLQQSLATANVGQCLGSTTACTQSSDCVGICENVGTGDTSIGRCFFSNIKPGKSTIANTSEPAGLAQDRLKQLFAKVYTAYRLESSVGNVNVLINPTTTPPAENQPEFRYKKITDLSDPALWDITDGSQSGVKPVPPTVAASVGGNTNLVEGIFSVNNSIGGVAKIIEIEEGSPAIINFFAWADKNQMPLKKVVVDWGTVNGISIHTTSTDEGRYKNRRAECDSSKDGFGGYKGGCEPGSYIYEYTYIPRELTYGPAPANEASVVFNCAAAGGTPLKGGKPVVPTDTDAFGTKPRLGCLIQPRVHLLDNWGWCTGSCTFNGVNGCYSSSCDIETQNGKSAWIAGPTIFLYARD